MFFVCVMGITVVIADDTKGRGCLENQLDRLLVRSEQ